MVVFIHDKGVIDFGAIWNRYLILAQLEENSGSFLFRNIARKRRPKLSIVNKPMSYQRARTELGFYLEKLATR